MSTPILKPHRGSISTMSSAKANLILQDGELFMERQEDGSYKFKVGDGVTVYSELPYSGGEDITGNATVADVLSGKTFCSANGKDLVGTYLPRTGTATTDQVLSGKTFSNSTSNNLTGTMTNINSINVKGSDFIYTDTNGYKKFSDSTYIICDDSTYNIFNSNDSNKYLVAGRKSKNGYINNLQVNAYNIINTYALTEASIESTVPSAGSGSVMNSTNYAISSNKPRIKIDSTTYYPMYAVSGLFDSSIYGKSALKDLGIVSSTSLAGYNSPWFHIDIKKNLYDNTIPGYYNKLGMLYLDYMYCTFYSTYRQNNGNIFFMFAYDIVNTPSSWYSSAYYNFERSSTYYNSSTVTPQVTFSTSSNTIKNSSNITRITGANSTFERCKLVNNLPISNGRQINESLEDKLIAGKSLVFTCMVGFTNEADRDYYLNNTSKGTFLIDFDTFSTPKLTIFSG